MSIKGTMLEGILRYAGTKMDGKKTYAGGAGKILLGITTIISGIVGLIGIAFPDFGFPEMSADAAIGLIAGGAYAVSCGLASIGIGHKIEKQTKAVTSPPVTAVSPNVTEVENG